MPKANRNQMIERIAAVLCQRGGTLVGEYVNTKIHIVVRCGHGHEWQVKPGQILRGSWCWECWKKDLAGKHFRLMDGMEQAASIAAERNGYCLSIEYTGTSAPMLWKCGNGHEWAAPLAEIKKGRWCPGCSGGVRERLCRAYIEHLVGRKFPKARPDWLVNARGHSMEFDGYCSEAGLAFEHHGAQHYIETTYFHKRNEKLKFRVEDDQRKRELCRAHSVALVEIPYTIENDSLPQWIFHETQRIAPGVPLRDWRSCERGIYVPSNELQCLKILAERRGGECLATVYRGVIEKHRFRCAKGHEWESTLANIKGSPRKRGSWCPVCKPGQIGDSNRKHSVEEMRRLAADRGGKFLSASFTSVNARCEWSCSKGHGWFAAPCDIMRGRWCRECSNVAKRGSIDDMRRIAGERGGECLSANYRRSTDNLRWRCSIGHEWSARPDNVKNMGSWCPVCRLPKRTPKPTPPSSSGSRVDERAARPAAPMST